MKSLVILPYSPWPVNTGTKIEMMKHLDVLKELGECTIVSAKTRPVGFGWTDEAVSAMQAKGFKLIFREDHCRLNPAQVVGIMYAAICKALKLDKAFGHANPYHRYEFSEAWIHELSKSYDLVVMQYGFWAHFRTACPKAVAVHELLSNYHWGWKQAETRDYAYADLLLTVGKDEADELKGRGLKNVWWSPPIAPKVTLSVNDQVGMIGTIAPQNIEGLQWLEKASGTDLKIRVYGNIVKLIKAPFFTAVGRYDDRNTPYADCGIHLMTRGDRPGLQIKVVEALACGRAIIARKGSMRGLPVSKDAYIGVDTPDEMLARAAELVRNKDAREKLAAEAGKYYDRYLDSGKVLRELRSLYVKTAGKK